MAAFNQSDIDILEFAVHEFGIGRKFTNKELKNALKQENKKREEDIAEYWRSQGYDIADNYVVSQGFKSNVPIRSTWSKNYILPDPNKVTMPTGKTFSDRLKRIPSDWPEFVKFEKEEFEVSFQTLEDKKTGKRLPFINLYSDLSEYYNVIDEPFIGTRYVIMLTSNVYDVLYRMQKELVQERSKKAGKKIAECFKKSGLSAEDFVEIVKNTIK